MKIDLTCPAELWRYELPREDYRACDLMMYNLADKMITSVEVTLILFDKADEELARLIYRAHDLHGEPGKTFGISVPVEEDASPATAEVVVEKVWFGDNSIWRRGKAAMTEYTSNALPNSRSLELLRYAAGPAAVGFPQEQDGLWMCVCGRPNADYTEYCIRCHKEKKYVFEQYSRENIEKLANQREQQLALKAKAAREDASRLQLQREAEYTAKKKKRRKITLAAIALALCAALVYVGVFHVLPYVNYQKAIQAMEGGKWQEAEAAFADMGDYLEAEGYVKQCQYLAAKDQMTSRDEQVVLAARNALSKLGEYQDAPALVQQADYHRAALLMDAGRLAEAREAFIQLGEYEESAAKATRCAYLMADELLQSADYPAAREAFAALGDYEDAADKAKQAVYLPGKAALEKGELDEALALLTQVPDYADAAELLSQLHYLYGVNLRDQGDYTAAGEKFLLAGDYADAADQANGCFYALADAAMQGGDYISAEAQFAKILTYQDAAEKRHACLYALATDRMDDLEFTLAREYLAQLPEDYQDVATLRQECWYQPAEKAYDRKDYAAAVEAYSQIPGYRDADKQLNKARYRLANSLADAKDYAAAIAQYELLGDYSDSVKKLRVARYNRANELLASGDYAGAQALYQLVNGYKDTEDKLAEIDYIQADSLLTAGDYAAARPLFVALGEHSDAKTKVKACDYLAAAALQQEGKLLEAAELFATIADYEDAQVKSGEAYYALGQAALKDGRSLQAAEYFTLAGSVQDAAQQAEAIYDQHYQGVAQQAQEAMDNGEYALTVQLLGQLDLTALPEKYASLQNTWQQANYREAERLLDAGDAYGALPYYQAIPEYKNVSSRLEKLCYKIIGTWQTREGEYYIFRENGTCAMAGEELLFNVDSYAMSTGTKDGGLLITHRISSVTGNEAVLYDLRDGAAKAIYLTRAELPEAADEPTASVEVVDE